MIKRYGILGSIRLLISLIYTKIFFRNARLIRLPFDIRNKKNIKIGKGLTTGFGCRLEAYPQKEISELILILGENVEINDYVHIAAGEKIFIGDNVLIASKVFISDLNHGNYKGKNPDSPLSTPNSRKLSTNPIIIKDNVWIGEGVCIMPGVTIGCGSVIGALSVVTKDIPDYSIAVGSPAKVVKEYDFESNSWKRV
ncbi:LbetaH domain-containing protein [Flavobacterium degerlachei]|jgi:lipopolysaccharide O-acetyltransferase|uniref:Lipopolysaccharide O-acetyltransferase n=1 Tax=Flavobacterium degerlachei TaxID=229203 RepID=A0A1H2VRE3_9FLAO|nr:acetyltransferase [Flavobacterium degerlachei]SDW70817.1 lipopolysaccharide O-acetyltransferase [Flavobacterium degerlachei]